MDTASDLAGGPVGPRPAATMVVVRAGREGIEALVARRSAASRFAPGFVVFPGGVVEDGDRELARLWFGSPTEVARACAVRELGEETGLVLTTDGVVAAPSEGGRADAPLDPAILPEIAHWVAPEFLPVRFDARFFCAEADTEAHPAPDGIEIDRAWWARPSEPLAAQRAGDASLMWPTFKMLEALESCWTVKDALALRVEQVAPPPGVRPPLSAVPRVSGGPEGER